MTDDYPIITPDEVRAIQAAIAACGEITTRLRWSSARRGEGLVYGLADVTGDTLFNLLNSAHHYAGVNTDVPAASWQVCRGCEKEFPHDPDSDYCKECAEVNAGTAA